jgi:hypothetical protein
LRTVAITSATGLAFVDLYFVTQARIPKIYLADAAAEIALVLAWLLASNDVATCPPGVGSNPAPSDPKQKSAAKK